MGVNPAMPPSKISIVVAPRQMLRLTHVSPNRHALPVALKANLAYDNYRLIKSAGWIFPIQDSDLSSTASIK